MRAPRAPYSPPSHPIATAPSLSYNNFGKIYNKILVSQDKKPGVESVGSVTYMQHLVN